MCVLRVPQLLHIDAPHRIWNLAIGIVVDMEMVDRIAAAAAAAGLTAMMASAPRCPANRCARISPADNRWAEAALLDWRHETVVVVVVEALSTVVESAPAVATAVDTEAAEAAAPELEAAVGIGAAAALSAALAAADNICKTRSTAMPLAGIEAPDIGVAEAVGIAAEWARLAPPIGDNI